MKKDRITPWIAIGLISLLMIVLLALKGKGLNSNIYSDYMDAYGDKELPYALFVLSDGSKESVSLWWSEEQQAYVLFAPGFWNDGEKVELCKPKASVTGIEWDDDSISLDNVIYKKKAFDCFSKGITIPNLAVGTHDLYIGGAVTKLIVMKESRIPSMMIEMNQEDYSIRKGEAYKDNENYKVWDGARVRLIDSDGVVSTAGLASEIRVRGNTSADWPKQPYQLTMKESTDFLGMGSAKKWNLLSNWSDRSLLRNKITYDMAGEAGLEYTPESELIDLYINGEYQGCYQLSEKVEIGRNRVDITNLEDLTVFPEDADKDQQKKRVETRTEWGSQIAAYEAEVKTDDLTGGYLLELERPSRIKDSISYFITKNGQPLTIRSPRYADVSEASYISAYWQGFEDALFSEDGINPGNGSSYLDYIDLESFVKKYLVEEIVRNYDASSTSQYFYKESASEEEARSGLDSRIYAGPVWDYDMSLGNIIMNKTTNQQYVSSIDPYGIYAAYAFDDFSIWARLYEKPEFYQSVKLYYKETYLPIIQKLLDGKLDGYADRIRASGIADMMRWGRLEEGQMQQWELEYDEAVDILRTFIKDREHYLTSLWIEDRLPRKIYLDGGEADMYVAWVEVFEGEKVPRPVGDPELEGYTFTGWNNGYTGEPYDFDKIYQGEDLYLEAVFVKD